MQKNKILFLINHNITLYYFRMELLQALLEDGYDITIASPKGDQVELFCSMGCTYVDTPMERRGMNPIQELKLLKQYKKLFREQKPDVILSYTIKPNVYGGMVAAKLKIPFIANVTGLGTAVMNGGLKQKITLFLYKQGLKRANVVFFQNQSNRQFLLDHHVVKGNHQLLPGSGVNLKKHAFEEYPSEDKPVCFVVVGRIMKDKGIDEILAGAEQIKKKHPEVRFLLLGFYDEDYGAAIEEAERKGLVEYLGQQEDVHHFMKESHAILHASHHEGMSNVLLEAAACGRPILATDIPGCRETFIEGKSGLGFASQNGKDLIRAIEQFLALPYEEKKAMGLAGRKHMEANFDRNIVVECYKTEIQKILNK